MWGRVNQLSTKSLRAWRGVLRADLKSCGFEFTQCILGSFALCLRFGFVVIHPSPVNLLGNLHNGI